MRLGHGAAGIWKRSPSARSSKYRLSGKRSYRRSKSSLISRFAKSSLPWQRWHAIAWCQEKGCHARMGAHCAAFTDWRRRRLCCGGGVDRPNCRRVGARDGDAGLGRRAPPISAAPPRQGRVKPEEAYRRYAAELAVSGINAWFFSSYSPSDEQIMLSPGARGSHRSIRERFRAWAEKTAEIAGFALAQPGSSGLIGLLGFSNAVFWRLVPRRSSRASMRVKGRGSDSLVRCQRLPAAERQRPVCQNFAELDSCLPVFSAALMQEAACCCSWPAINPIASAFSACFLERLRGCAIVTARRL